MTVSETSLRLLSKLKERGCTVGRGYNLASVSGALDPQKLPTPHGLSMNAYNTFRHNRILVNGGILIGDDSSNVVVEGNEIEYPGGWRGPGLPQHFHETTIPWLWWGGPSLRSWACGGSLCISL